MGLHLITGQNVGQDSRGIMQKDTSLTGLSMLYGVSLTSIQNANFGGTSLEHLYSWLAANGGTRQGADPGVPTGYHWSFTPGMVIEIPGAVSKSPPPANIPVDPAGPTTPGVEPGSPVVTQKAGVGVGGGLTTWLLIGVAVYFFMNGGKKGKKRRKPRRKRKTTRRRRRRNYYRSYYGGGD
jgi:hypothetical protein